MIDCGSFLLGSEKFSIIGCLFVFALSVGHTNICKKSAFLVSSILSLIICVMTYAKLDWPFKTSVVAAIIILKGSVGTLKVGKCIS